MKKGKYIDYNILLACLSHKPKAKNDQMLPGTGTLPERKQVIEFISMSAIRRVA